MATFNLIINPSDTPVAADNSYNLQPNTNQLLDVIANDFLGEEPTTLIIEVAPTLGTAEVTDTNGYQRIDYTCNTGVVGTDTLYYRITDSTGAFDTGVVNITIG